MKMKKNTEIVEIQEAVKISQDDHELILEKGDKIEILKEASFGNIYLRGPRKYEVLTGPGVSASHCEYSSDEETDSIDVKKLQKAIEESFEDMGEKGLAEYISRQDYMDKVISIPPPIPCDGYGRVHFREVFNPYLFWTVYTSDVLDKKEEKALLDFIRDQCSDGWGREFEQHLVHRYSGEWEEGYDYEDDTGEWYWETNTIVATYEVYYSPWQRINWDIRITSSGKAREKATSRKNNYITIKEEVRIPQSEHEIILEKGDKIQIIKEDQTITWKDFLGMKLLAHERLSEFVFDVPYKKIKVEGSYVSCMLLGNSLHMKFKNKIDTFTLTPDLSDVVTIYEDNNYGFKVQLKEFNGVFYGYY